MWKQIRGGLCLLTTAAMLAGTAMAADSAPSVEQIAMRVTESAAAPASGSTGTAGAASGNAGSASGNAGAASEPAVPESQGYLVKFKTDAPTLQSAEAKTIRRSSLFSRLHAISGGVYYTEDKDAADRLAQSSAVECVEPNYTITLGEIPNDTYLLSGDQWYYNLLGLDGCWARGLTGKGIRVGVVDSGLFPDHEDLQGAAIIPGTNYTVSEDSEERSNTADEYGHGTMVCGLIAAAVGNEKGIAGLASSVELVPLKGFQGRTSSVANLVADIYGGVDDYHCDVLNLSVGVRSDSSILRAAIQHADEQGVIVIAAAGNLDTGETSTGNDAVYYPAAWPEAIGVGAVGQDLSVAWYSRQNSSVWIAAPGSALWSLSYQNAGRYSRGNGTSYAVPIVTAAAALALSVKPDLTRVQLMELMKQTARDLGAPGYDNAYGHGLLNIGLLMATLEGDVAWQASSLARQHTAANRLLLAGYDGQGIMQYVRTQGTDDGAANTVPEAEQWKLFVLDGEKMAPVREAYSLSGKRYTGAAS